MAVAEKSSYLNDILDILKAQWPDNRMVNIACHGHSVPSGYFQTPVVDTFNAYPHLLHKGLKERFPFSVINVIVTAIGGESSDTGSERFNREVLNHRPDVVTIDYALNDRHRGLQETKECWNRMIEEALAFGSKVILMTPSCDMNEFANGCFSNGVLGRHAEQIRGLADEYGVGLCDSLAVFEAYVCRRGDASDFQSWRNHPNRLGHDIITRELLRWFPVA